MNDVEKLIEAVRNAELELATVRIMLRDAQKRLKTARERAKFCGVKVPRARIVEGK